MLRSITVTLAATVAVALAACGSGEDTASSNVMTERAKSVVERAAHLELAPEPIPDDAREQGLRASYSNAATAVKDKQVVALFVMKDAGVADEVSDTVRSSAPESARLIVNGKVMVVHAAAGSDHGTAVENANGRCHRQGTYGRWAGSSGSAHTAPGRRFASGPTST